jgi:hypothetical protein
MQSYVVITGFSSHYGGNGYGRRALAWMAANLGPITVADPGKPYENPDSFGFWKRMAEEGLIHRIEDEDNIEIYREGVWTIPEDEEELYLDGFPEGLPTSVNESASP